MESITQNKTPRKPDQKGFNRAGVYQIVCRVNNKRYIGSATWIRVRWSTHRAELRSGRHHSARLQNAWNKYGENAFFFGVLEFTSIESRLEREQAWIDLTGAANPKIGYNIGAVAGGPVGCRRSESHKKKLSDDRAGVWDGFISPSGEIVTIVNMEKFCRENNLNSTSMMGVYHGRTVSCHGWRHVNRQSKQIKTYDGFVDPDGNAVGVVVGIAQFCRERGIDRSAMALLARGVYKQYRGWTWNP